MALSLILRNLHVNTTYGLSQVSCFLRAHISYYLNCVAENMEDLKS